MTISRFGFHNRGFALGLTLTMALVLTACVSVKESGTKVSAPPPPPTTSVAFHSNPNNAEVYVNGEFRGTAPLSLHLAAGVHKVELRLDGFQIWERELTVVAGNDTRVAATLQPE
jgi:PEGA domain